MITIERLARIAMEDMAIRDVIYYSDLKNKQEDWQDDSSWEDDESFFFNRDDSFDSDNLEDDYEEDDFQEGDYQEDDFQEGDYQEDIFQESDFQEGGYREDDYREDDYREDDYREDNYCETDYQEDNYHETEFRDDDFQQGDMDQDTLREESIRENEPFTREYSFYSGEEASGTGESFDQGTACGYAEESAALEFEYTRRSGTGTGANSSVSYKESSESNRIFVEREVDGNKEVFEESSISDELPIKGTIVSQMEPDNSDVWTEPLSTATDPVFEGMESLARERKELEALYKKFEEEKRQFRSEMKKLNQRASDERRRLKEEESFFDKKMDILKGGFAQLEADKAKLEREKISWERERLNLVKRKDAAMREDSMRIFFVGVNNPITLKKRYRDLIKIFHPDNVGGDNAILQKINKLYDSMWAEMGWQKKA